MYYYDGLFVRRILEEINNKGIVLLTPCDSARFFNILKKDNISDIYVVAFSIGSGTSRRILVRRSLYMYKSIDFSKIEKEGNAAYKSKDYDLFIEKYKPLLGYIGKAYVYAKLGLAYAIKLDKQTAIDYLTVATELAKKEKADFELTKLITSLKEKIEKPIFEMNTKNIREAIDLVLKVPRDIFFEKNIAGVCEELYMNEEQKAKVLLILSRNLYALENYSLGDYYLEKVNETINKLKVISSDLCSLLQEIEKNKYNYCDSEFYYDFVYYYDYDRPLDKQHVKTKYLESNRFLKVPNYGTSLRDMYGWHLEKNRNYL